MRLRLTESKQTNRGLRISYIWCDYDKISITVKKAVVISEDQSFLQHNGFDYDAIYSAYRKNKQLGVDKYGASTITQQTVKNLFLWSGKSWVRKAFEAYFTILVEFYWSKKRILEMYLNITEFGDGIFGIESASLKYFNVEAANLNQFQASLLAVTLPNPLKLSVRNPSKRLIFRAKLNQIHALYSKDLDKL